MLILKEVQRLPMTAQDLRKFGITVGAVFGVLGGFFLWRGKDISGVFLGAFVFLVFFGLAAPKMLKFVYMAWMTLALLMGWVMTRVILLIVFYGVMTPIAFIMKCSGKDILNMRFGGGESSHWVKRRPKDKNSYTQQF